MLLDYLCDEGEIRISIVLEYNIDEEDWVRLNKTTEEHLHSGGHASVPAALFGCL